MATAPPTSRPTVPAEQARRIHSPLHKLRGTIRRYVAWDSLALAVVLLAAWFWIGLVLDYGVFKTTGVDWVQVLPWTMRLVILVLVAGGVALAIALALRSLLREFRPDALALVLERRFPKLLGDKLITAVELADLDRAETYGYSRAMILQTVQDVSARVGQIPVATVFNWRRLYRRWAWAAALSLGLLALTALAYLGWRRTTDVGDFGHRFGDVSAIWFERNVLLQNTLWPRRAYLQILDFPESGELRIGRDAPSPRVRVRALKWVIADRAAPDGWRGLTWADLNSDLLTGRPVPTLPTALLVPPAEARSAPPANDPYWSLDRAELLLDEPAVQKRLLAGGLPAEQYEALRGVFEALDQKAGQAAMSRRLRKLEVPAEVRIHYWGAKSSDDAPMQRQQQGVYEYAVVLTDLKESVKFYVKGEDYSTYPDRRITLVPPPMLTRLEKDEYVPAYQFYRPPADGKAEDLKGKRQARLGQGVSLTGGTSRVETAGGADLTLRGELDKELSAARIRYRTAGKEGEAGRVEPLPVGDDRRSIRVDFKNVTRPIEFDFEFTDTDNVKSLRHVVIQPLEDRTPDVNVVVETIRKVGGNYMCTPYAMLPFTGTVRDDVGLSRVEYAVSYTRVESAQVLGLRAAVAAGVLQLAPVSPAPRELLGAAGVIDYFARLSESRQTATTLPPIPLKTFEEIARDKDREFAYGKDRLPELLAAQDPNLDELRRRRQVMQFDVKAKNEWLDLRDSAPDLQRDLDATVRPRYRLRVVVQAVDNNVETGPRTGQNKETFTFLVVPFEELLAEMNKDDENLGAKARDLSEKMYDVRNALDKVVERMPRQEGHEEFRSAASRLDEILAELEKGLDVAKDLLNECQRLLAESEANRLPTKIIEDRTAVIGLLDEAIRGHFERAREAHTAFRDVVQARRPPEPAVVETSRRRQTELNLQLDQIRDRLGTALDVRQVAAKLGDLIENRLVFERFIKQVKQDAEDKIEILLGELAPTAPPVELRSGEKKVVTIDLGRGEFIKSRLKLMPAVPPGSELSVAPSLIVERLVKNAFVEITAGTKTGTFAVPVAITEPDGTPIRHKDNKTLTLQVTVK